MVCAYSSTEIEAAGAREISDKLEQGHIIFFPTCPFELPAPEDLEFLRAELPNLLQLKNVSYHPETDRISGIEKNAAPAARSRDILKKHSERVAEFLQRVMPELAQNWTVGTSSFRPIQEKGRNLKPHASNELIHIDAGAYGATNGDRILRFFVNVNPQEDRVWATKGSFPNLYSRYGKAAGMTENGAGVNLDKGLLDRLWGGFLRTLAALGLPQARVIDSSPYDRLMRRFHNFMKDTPEFQADPHEHEEIRFKPFSAWMVLTDMVSHASVSGQHALVHTSLLRVENCRLPELAPINILKSGRVPGPNN